MEVDYTDKYFAVLDTETNWKNEVMSLGLVIANQYFLPEVKCYYIFVPEYKVGGMFSKTLQNVQSKGVNKYIDTRPKIIASIRNLFTQYGINAIFAYNARFDLSHLPELKDYKWHDIMRIAAYKQYNGKIPDDIECHSHSGRIKRGFGVQPIYRMVTGNTDYKEKHNGYHDAEDELVIMQKLELPFEIYANSRIN